MLAEENKRKSTTKATFLYLVALLHILLHQKHMWPHKNQHKWANPAPPNDAAQRFCCSLVHPCVHAHTRAHTAVGGGGAQMGPPDRKELKNLSRLGENPSSHHSWLIHCPYEDDYFGQNMWTVHSKDTDRRFNVSRPHEDWKKILFHREEYFWSLTL